MDYYRIFIIEKKRKGRGACVCMCPSVLLDAMLNIYK